MSHEYFSLLFWVIGFSLAAYKFFYVIELSKYHRNHLNYIRTICEKYNLKIAWKFFDSMEDAEIEYKNIKNGLLVPYGYKYQIKDSDEVDLNDLTTNLKSWKYSIIDVLQENSLFDKEFINLIDFRNRMDLKKEYTIKLAHSWENKILWENFVLSLSDLDWIMRYIEEWKSFIVVEWYLFVNFIENE